MSLSADTAAIRDALARERLNLLVQGTPSSVAATALASLVVVSLLARAGSPAIGAGWYALLLLALGVRGWMRRRSLRQGAALHDAGAELPRHRVAFLLHGLVWMTLLPVLLVLPDNGTLTGIVFIWTAMVGGALVTNAFDQRAAAMFAMPAGLGLAIVLLALPHTRDPQLALAAAVFVLMMGMAGWRAARLFEARVQSEVAERERYAEARRHADDADAARRELADQHALMQQLLRGTSQGFWFVAPDGRTLDINPAMCELLGRERGSLMGMVALDALDGAARERMAQELERRRGGQRGAYEITIVRPDGSMRHAVNQATPIFNDEGRHIGSIGLWTDLTALKALERELRAYERVTNSVDDLVSVVGPDGRYRLVNDAWCRTVGRARDEVIGQPWLGLMEPYLEQARVEAFEACRRDGRAGEITTATALRDGREAILQTRFFPIRDDGDAAGSVILVTRDITGQERDRAAVEASAEYLRRVLDATGDAIYATDSVDADAPVRFCNQQLLDLCALRDHTPDTVTPAVLRRMARMLYAEPEVEAQQVRAIVAAGQHHESFVKLRDGRIIHRRFAHSAIQGRSLRVWTFRDVTVEHRAMAMLHDREAQQRALLDAFPGFIACFDSELRYTYSNEPLAQLAGRTVGQLIGRPVHEVIGRRRARAFAELARQVLAGKPQSIEREYNGPEGPITVQMTLANGRDPRSGEPVVYAFGADISGLKRAERALAAARDEADRANRAKSQFLAHMSHELRTPMNAVLGFAQLLMLDRRPELAAHQQGYARQILQGAQHLLDLINELLDLGRIEAGRMLLELQPVPAAEVAADCLALVRELARSHGVALLPTACGEGPEGSPDPMGVVADRTRLRQVVLNLLSNAIKYNRPQGEVQLRLRRDGGEVVIEVRDTGNGIPPEAQARLFAPFERLGAERSKVEGTGIGLALSRRLVEAMRGRIGVDTGLGEGSVFWLRLPAHAVAPSAVPAEQPAEQPAESPSPLAHDEVGPSAQGEALCEVLYIDDNAVNLLLVESVLEQVPGIRLSTARRPGEGLAAAQQRPPHLVLLDIQMPEMDGYAVLARLQAHPATAAVPVVALSANANPGDITAARAAGFAAYLTKPLDVEELLDVLQRLSRPGQDPASSAT